MTIKTYTLSIVRTLRELTGVEIDEVSTSAMGGILVNKTTPKIDHTVLELSLFCYCNESQLPTCTCFEVSTISKKMLRHIKAYYYLEEKEDKEQVTYSILYMEK